jgi:predicted esterase
VTTSRIAPIPRAPARRFAALLAAALALAVLPASAAGQDDRAPTRDQVSIEDRPGYVEAVGRIANGDEEAGIRTLEEIAKKYGGDPDLFMLHYNVACGRARLKQVDAALASLAKAVELGYAVDAGQFERLKGDPDLASLRADPRYAALVADALRRAAGLAKELEAELAPFTWVPPPPAGQKPAALPLLIVLHPFGSDGETFARASFLPFAQKHGFALLAPTGEFMTAPHRLGWFRGEADFIDHFRLAARRVFFALEEFRKKAPIDPERIYVTGLGQGAALGFALAVRNPQWARGAVLFGGGYAPTTLEEWQKMAARYGRRIALVHGKDDEIYPLEPLPPFVADLQKKGLSLELTVLDGGHGLAGPDALEPLLLDRLKWIDEAPWKPAPPPAGGR